MRKKKKGKCEIDDIISTLGDAWTLYHGFGLIVGIILFFVGLFAWGYVISQSGGSCRKLLIAEVIVQVIVLVGSFLRIGFFDYDEGIIRHILITFATDSVLSVIGFYLAGIHILQVTGDAQAEAFYYIMDFLLELLLAMALGFLPALLIAVLMWVLVRVFGRPL